MDALHEISKIKFEIQKIKNKLVDFDSCEKRLDDCEQSIDNLYEDFEKIENTVAKDNIKLKKIFTKNFVVNSNLLFDKFCRDKIQIASSWISGWDKSKGINVIKDGEVEIAKDGFLGQEVSRDILDCLAGQTVCLTFCGEGDFDGQCFLECVVGSCNKGKCFSEVLLGRGTKTVSKVFTFPQDADRVCIKLVNIGEKKNIKVNFFKLEYGTAFLGYEKPLFFEEFIKLYCINMLK